MSRYERYRKQEVANHWVEKDARTAPLTLRVSHHQGGNSMSIRYLSLLIVLGLVGCAVVIRRPIEGKQVSNVDAKLEYLRAGEGQPTIVFLSGYGADIDASWSKILPEAKNISTAFAYNRYNYGNSDRADVPQTGEKVIASLRSLLKERRLAPPYVLVAHSLGGMYAQLFAREYPMEVSGVVLIDSSHPDQEEMRSAREGAARRAIGHMTYWFDSVTHPVRHSEIASFSETAKQIKAAMPFPDIPLIVISARKEPSWWVASDESVQIFRENQQRLVGLSPQGRQIVARKSGHFIQNDEPEIVLQAIREVVNQVRGQ